MRNLLTAARNWARQPEISVRNSIKVGVKLYMVAAVLMFMIGFVATLYQGAI